jgi:RNA polymerase sigma-70 factor (ECF subfamily)
MDSVYPLRYVSHKLDLTAKRSTLVNINSGTTATTPLSDLVKRAQQGDSDAFAALFHMHKARIYSVCLRMTNNAAEAEDLTQDAFLQVFRKIASFRGDSAFSTWLHRISVNTVLMHFRKKSLSQVSLDEPYDREDGSKVRREVATQDNCLAGCVDRIALARAMKELPPGYRTIFLLHEVEGYEHQEIAEMLGCSVGNSKSQLYKAKLRIRELLAHSPEARLAIRGQARSKKRTEAPEQWNLPEAMVMPPVPVAPQLMRPTA